MTEDCNKDLLAVKAPKKTPLLLRSTVVLFAVFCGLYMFTICIRQTRFATDSSLFKIQLIQDPPCDKSGYGESELAYLHFPKPQTFRRKECACNPVRLFAILSMQRSGSGWFETLLNSHVNISSNGEIFGAKDRRSNASRVVEVLDQVYNLDWFSSASKNECSAAVGFKWMLNQKFYRTVTNVGDGAAIYNIKVTAPKGSVVTVSPDTLVFQKRHEKKSYTMTINFKAVIPTVTSGSLVWIEKNSKNTVRSPIVISPAVDMW